MNIIDLPASIYVMTGSLSIAFVSCISAYATTVSNKENKTSEFRQEWANSLRDEAADLLSLLTELNITFTIMAEDTSGIEEYSGPDIISNPYIQKIISLKSNIKTQSCKVILRLNPRELKSAKSIESKIKRNISSIEEMASMDLEKIRDASSLTKRNDDITREIESLESNLSDIIKENWDKVKLGENSYKTARNATGCISIIILVILLAAISLLTYSTFFAKNRTDDDKKNVAYKVELTTKNINLKIN